MDDIKHICENYSEQDLIFLSGSIFTNAEERYAVACVLMACADDAISPTVFDGMKQEAAEDMYDEGPRPFGIVGGEIMEFGPQRGGDIPF